MARLRLSVSARADLEAIQRNGLENFGAVSTRAYIAGFEKIFALRQDHPTSGPARADFGADIRQFAYPPHRPLYRLRGDEIPIVRILHFAMDVRGRLSPDA